MNDRSVMEDFAVRRDRIAAEIDALIGRLLSSDIVAGEIARPPRLIEAMRHAALSGGKRLRPLLVAETADLFDVPRERALMAGAAIECVHAYSLIHDDLPAMDDAAMRRGRASLHKAFDEATAILAGDSLLTFAFDILARPETHPDAETRIALALMLARAAGMGGMAGGQMLDLAAEGRFAGGQTQRLGESEVVMLQAMKTGALLRCACSAGAILGSADQAARAAIDKYGAAIGQAFQIADDLLDREGEAAALGKPTGKDAAAGKATLVGILGPADARARLAALVDIAEAALEPFGGKAEPLRTAARFIAVRQA